MEKLQLTPHMAKDDSRISKISRLNNHHILS